MTHTQVETHHDPIHVRAVDTCHRPPSRGLQGAAGGNVRAGRVFKLLFVTVTCAFEQQRSVQSSCVRTDGIRSWWDGDQGRPGAGPRRRQPAVGQAPVDRVCAVAVQPHEPDLLSLMRGRALEPRADMTARG